LMYLEMCLFVKRAETDGLLAASQVDRIPRPDRKEELRRLVDVGLVAAVPGGWHIVDWLDFNESLADRDARRALDRFRKELTEDVRREVFARDGHRCLRCGALDDLTIDHIIPVSQGGTHRIENLQTLCGSCNSAKGDR
jgi:hypothetical protein